MNTTIVPRPLHAALLASLAALGLLAGCNTPDDGRMDPYATSSGENRSSEILPASLLEFSDQYAQRLTQKLAGILEIAGSAKPVTIYMGDLNNLTKSVSSNEFQMVQSRIRSTLLSSDFVRKHILFKEDITRVTNMARREGQPGVTVPTDPASTYYLNGDFYQIQRTGAGGETNLYYMEYQLVNSSTGVIIFSDRYDQKQFKS